MKPPKFDNIVYYDNRGTWKHVRRVNDLYIHAVQFGMVGYDDEKDEIKFLCYESKGDICVFCEGARRDRFLYELMYIQVYVIDKHNQNRIGLHNVNHPNVDLQYIIRQWDANMSVWGSLN